MAVIAVLMPLNSAQASCRVPAPVVFRCWDSSGSWLPLRILQNHGCELRPIVTEARCCRFSKDFTPFMTAGKIKIVRARYWRCFGKDTLWTQLRKMQNLFTFITCSHLCSFRKGLNRKVLLLPTPRKGVQKHVPLVNIYPGRTVLALHLPILRDHWHLDIPNTKYRIFMHI